MEPGNVNAEKAFAILTRKTGINGMMGGQSVDVQLDGQPLSDELLNYIYALKTGALLEASLMIGAQLAGAGDEVVAGLENVGALIGMAFQITDDILDVTSDTATLGKPVGSDAAQHKSTYVTLCGVEGARAHADAYTADAVRALDPFAQQGEALRQLALSLANRLK